MCSNLKFNDIIICNDFNSADLCPNQRFDTECIRHRVTPSRNAGGFPDGRGGHGSTPRVLPPTNDDITGAPTTGFLRSPGEKLIDEFG